MALLISMLFIGTFAGTVLAQGATGGQLMVSAVDRNLNPVWGANITINATGGAGQTMAANNSGMVTFTNLTPGDYNVTGERNGIAAFPTSANVSGSGMQNVTLHFLDLIVNSPPPATPTPAATAVPTQAPSATKTPGFEIGFAVLALTVVAIVLMGKKK